MYWDGAGTENGSASHQDTCSWLGVESGAERDEVSLFALSQGWLRVHKGISPFFPLFTGEISCTPIRTQLG